MLALKNPFNFGIEALTLCAARVMLHHDVPCIGFYSSFQV